MKLTNTKDYFLIGMIVAAGLALSFTFGSADGGSGSSRAAVVAPSVESFVYFPAQYPLDAHSQVNEHIQAF